MEINCYAIRRGVLCVCFSYKIHILSHVKLLNLLLMNSPLQEISFLKAKLKDAQVELQVAETKIKVSYDVLMNESAL